MLEILDHYQPTIPLWKQTLRQNFTHWEKLSDYLELSLEQRQKILKKTHFILNLPLRLAAKIQKQTLEDPILKQFLPTLEETISCESFKIDPVGDSFCAKTPKLLHKYQGRVLLVTTSACAMHCRYCFRQNFPYETKSSLFQEELLLITQDASIREVILSGGDPLSLGDQQLKTLLSQLDKIPHLKKIRFHTRFPIGIPERIDDSFLQILASCQKQIWFVIHSNHPRELDDYFFQKMKAIQKLGIPILNQTVLLKGVNDQLDILKQLFETLTDQGIMPYYLHQLDKVMGAQHFEVPVQKGQTLIEELTKVLPGYAIPKYVCELSGEPSKTRIL